MFAGYIITMIHHNGYINMRLCLFIFVGLFHHMWGFPTYEACDSGCTCSPLRSRTDDTKPPTGQKVVCTGDLITLTDLTNITFPNDTVQL